MAQVQYITGPQVAARYRITPTTLCRWQKDASLNFPKPLKINHRNYWSPQELDEFDARQRSILSSRGA